MFCGHSVDILDSITGISLTAKKINFSNKILLSYLMLSNIVFRNCSDKTLASHSVLM